MAQEVGGDWNGVAVDEGRRHARPARGRRKGREGLRPDRPAGLLGQLRGEGLGQKATGLGKKKKLEFNFELISRFRKMIKENLVGEQLGKFPIKL
jgi:hypothetical protein